MSNNDKTNKPQIRFIDPEKKPDHYLTKNGQVENLTNDEIINKYRQYLTKEEIENLRMKE